MTDSNPTQATPPAALNVPAHTQPHHDSEESVRYERRRVSRELEPYLRGSSSPSTSIPRASTPTFANLRSRSASLRSSTNNSLNDLRRHASAISGASTQPDMPGADDNRGQNTRSCLKVPHWYDPMVKFWTTHVCPTMDEGAYRDHLALERTFLGYLRTSLMFVMTGILIAQLFRLQPTVDPNPHFSFYVIGSPLSATFISMGIVVILVGAVRFWRLQRGLIAGKAHAGGWEVLAIMGLSALLLMATFALVLAVGIDMTYFH